MRLPIAVSIESRNGATTKDAKVLNGIVEVEGETLRLRKRPGISDLGTVKVGTAQALTAWNGIKTVQGDYLNAGTISTIVSAPTQTNLTPTNAGLHFDAQATNDDAATPRLMLKNRTQAWTVNRAGTVSAVTYGGSMGGGTYNVVSITRSGTTATATIAEDVFNVGDSVTVAGATQADYNITATITAITVGSNTPAVGIPITITRTGTTATATTVSGTPHGLANATSYTVSGANESAYNGAKTIATAGGNTFTYPVSVTFTSPATGTPTYLSNLKSGTVTGSGFGGTLTVTCTNHSLETGAAITIFIPSRSIIWQGMSVTSTSANTFTITNLSTYTFNDACTFRMGTNPATKTFTCDGTTVTVTTSTPHRFASGTGWTLTTSGAIPTYYNAAGLTFTVTSTTEFTFPVPAGAGDPTSPGTGTIVVTKPAVIVNSTFDYTVAGSPATPATGTITVQGTGGTVPGIPYINGYFCVMDSNGVIWHSASDDPTTWSALSFTTAQVENGAGKALAKSREYLVAFKEWSTEAFYDAQNPTGSVFSPVANGFTKIGCANGHSLAEVDGVLLWIAQSKNERSRSVYMGVGIDQAKVSTPAVDRIVSADSLSEVHAYGLSVDGHSLYILTLTETGVTLAFDLGSKTWAQWSSLTRGDAQTGLQVTYTVDSAGDGYQFYEIEDPARVIVTGDYIEYEVWIEAASAAASTSSDGGLLLTFTDATNSQAAADQNGEGVFAPGTSMDPRARGLWYQRRVSLAAFVGKTCDGVIVGGHSNSVGVHNMIFRNIHFTDGSANTRQSVYVTGAPTTSTVYLTNLTSGASITGTTVYTARTVTSITRSGNTATVVFPLPHGLEDGDPLEITGASQSAYNEIFQVRYVDNVTVSFTVEGEPATPATGTILVYPYTETHFKFTKAASYNGETLLLHESDGHLYQIEPGLYRDDGIPINVFARTARMDGGTTARKTMPIIRVIADKVDDVAMVRWSDDDCETFSSYRPVDLSLPEPELRRCGAFQRRTIELRYIGNYPFNASGLEVDVR